MLTYIIEVYGPSSIDTPWFVLKSETPFMSIHAGDLFNPGASPGSEGPMKTLRVVAVEHVVVGVEDANGMTDAKRHKLLVFTEHVQRIDDVLRGGPR